MIIRRQINLRVGSIQSLHGTRRCALCSVSRACHGALQPIEFSRDKTYSQGDHNPWADGSLPSSATTWASLALGGSLVSAASWPSSRKRLCPGAPSMERVNNDPFDERLDQLAVKPVGLQSLVFRGRDSCWTAE